MIPQGQKTMSVKVPVKELKFISAPSCDRSHTLQDHLNVWAEP